MVANAEVGGGHGHDAGRPGDDAESRTWTFLTNYSHVLLCIHEDPDIRLADIAVKVGIRERAVQKIVADLVDAGYLTRTRIGRRNHYAVQPETPLRHQLEAHHDIGDLLELLASGRN